MLGVLEEQCAQHRVALPGGEPGLGVDVGHEPVPELHDAPEVVGEPLAVLPRLGGRQVPRSRAGGCPVLAMARARVSQIGSSFAAGEKTLVTDGVAP